MKPGTRTCLVQNGESETRTFPQNYAISINSDNACFMSYYYRDKIIAIICFCLTNAAITYRCVQKSKKDKNILDEVATNLKLLETLQTLRNLVCIIAASRI